jgi:hypothetical protein
MLRSGISKSPDQIRLEMAQEQAVLNAGERFISLRLINSSVNKIQGAICLNAIPYLDTQTNITKFHFEKTGKPLIFDIDEYKGGMYCKMLDCEHNRKFLASMFASNFWQIEDKKTEDEIRILAMEIKKKVVKVPEFPKGKDTGNEELAKKMAEIAEAQSVLAVEEPIVKDANPEKQELTDDDIEAQIARLQAEKARRVVKPVMVEVNEVEPTEENTRPEPKTEEKKPQKQHGMFKIGK